MNSIAIWAEKDITETVLHINIWHTLNHIKWYKQVQNKFANYFCHIQKTNEFSNYLEFGIQFKNNEDDNKIYIFVPISDLLKEDIEDKIILLENDLVLTKALFNSKAEIVSDNMNNDVIVKIKDNVELVYKKIIDYKVESTKSGSIIEISLTKMEKQQYYRFRINKIYDLIKEVNYNSSLIDGYVDKKAILEFNVNHTRKIPADIFSKFRNIQFIKINCFLLTDDDVNIDSLHNSNYSARILEKHIWNKYVDENVKMSNIVAYQWDIENDIDSFLLLLKLNYRIKKLFFFIKMLFFIIALGAISGVAGNYTTEYLKNYSKQDKTIEKQKKEDKNASTLQKKS